MGGVVKISRVNEGKRFVNVFKVRTGTRLLIWAKKKNPKHVTNIISLTPAVIMAGLRLLVIILV